MALSTNLGFPRIGPKRELKKATEEHWSGKKSEAELIAAANEIRRGNWELQRRAGLDHIPSNDFSFYDHVLDTAAMVGAVPPRYNWSGATVDLRTYLREAYVLPFLLTMPLVAVLLLMKRWFIPQNYRGLGLQLLIGAAVYGSGLAWAHFTNRALRTGELVIPQSSPTSLEVSAIADAVEIYRGEI